MGDRTSVALRVLTSQVERVKEIIKGEYYETDYYDPDLTIFDFDEVNYGELPFLQKLEKAGIPYNSRWGKGDDYGSGETVCRFTPEGEALVVELCDAEDNPRIASLLERLDKPEELVQYILDYVGSRKVYPWDNQEDYGKLYRMKQLITTS